VRKKKKEEEERKKERNHKAHRAAIIRAITPDFGTNRKLIGLIRTYLISCAVSDIYGSIFDK